MINRRKFIATSAAIGINAINPIKSYSMTEQSLYVPPEEAAHELTFMQWPVSKIVHPDRYFLDDLQGTIADIANAISEFEIVILLMGAEYKTRAKKLLSSSVEIWDIPTEDLWARDAGPLFAVQNDELVISHIQFNGWGDKQIHEQDGSIVQNVSDRLGVKIVNSGLVGEAGGVEHDGHGLLMAHESSWLNDNRNPGLSRIEIEKRLIKAYGADKMIWSKGVYYEDITDYHIDSLARFTGPGNVLINLPDAPDMSDPFHVAALDTYDQLKAAGLNITVIPEPEIRRIDAIDFVASYANYYVCNGAVIAAQFGDKEADDIAKQALKKAYPEREIITLNVDALGEVGGGIHCATQQMPKV